MSAKPVVALLLTKATQSEVIGDETRALLNERFDARWPEHDGKFSLEQAVALAKDAEGCMTGWGSPALTPELLAQAPKLRITAHSAGTVKPYVSDAVWARGMVVTSAAAGIAVDVAHYAVGLMAIGRKNLMELAPQAGAGKWRGAAVHRRSESLRGSTVGIVSASHVGRNVMRLLQHFDVKVLLYDPFVNEKQAQALGAVCVELDELFRLSDIVSIHAPKIPETDRMVDARRLALMKDGAILINTARGSIVDETALVAELAKKRIWAFLDVTDPEPPPPGSPLYGCPNLTLSPHVAGSCGEARKVLGRMACDELVRFFQGEPPMYPVTQEMLARIG